MTHLVYAIVDKDGELVRRGPNMGGTIRVYASKRVAENNCKWEGDSVIPLTFDTDRGDEPLFIRRKTLDGRP